MRQDLFSNLKSSVESVAEVQQTAHNNYEIEMLRQQQSVQSQAIDADSWVQHFDSLLQCQHGGVQEFLTKELQKDIPTGSQQLLSDSFYQSILFLK